MPRKVQAREDAAREERAKVVDGGHLEGGPHLVGARARARARAKARARARARVRARVTVRARIWVRVGVRVRVRVSLEGGPHLAARLSQRAAEEHLCHSESSRSAL